MEHKDWPLHCHIWRSWGSSRWSSFCRLWYEWYVILIECRGVNGGLAEWAINCPSRFWQISSAAVVVAVPRPPSFRQPFTLLWYVKTYFISLKWGASEVGPVIKEPHLNVFSLCLLRIRQSLEIPIDSWLPTPLKISSVVKSFEENIS